MLVLREVYVGSCLHIALFFAGIGSTLRVSKFFEGFVGTPNCVSLFRVIALPGEDGGNRRGGR